MLARASPDGLPPAEPLLADRGFDADWYREAPEDNGVNSASHSGKASRS